MGRTACVDAPAFPLQLLLKQRPEWAGGPASVVDRDRPQGVLRWVNEAARAAGVRPGMRFAAGVSVARELRAAEVPEEAIRAGVAQVASRLGRFSPGVEPCGDVPGVFWLDATGLGRLFGSARPWAQALQADLIAQGFSCRVAVGFTRFGTFAAARAGLGDGLALFRTPAEEQRAVHGVGLEHWGASPKLREALGRLGVRTAGELLRLPAGGLRERFGPEALALHRRTSGQAELPLAPEAAPEPLADRLDLEEPEANAERLLFAVKLLLDPLLERLAGRREAMAALELRLALDGPPGQSEERREHLAPATPTLDARQVLNLVHLRLQGADLGAGIVALTLTVTPAPAHPAQLALFAGRPRRDLEAAARALARVRAELGDGAVVHAALREGHLPEAKFTWEPLGRLEPAAPRAVSERPLVRRLLDRPTPLPPSSRTDPDGWLLAGEAAGPVDEQLGPYIVSGGWWRRPVHREYYFARTRSGRIFWIYRDRERRRWFLQGEVE